MWGWSGRRAAAHRVLDLVLDDVEGILRGGHPLIAVQERPQARAETRWRRTESGRDGTDENQLAGAAGSRRDPGSIGDPLPLPASSARFGGKWHRQREGREGTGNPRVTWASSILVGVGPDK